MAPPQTDRALATAIDQLAAIATGTVQRHAPLAKCSTYRIGGPAAALFTPASVDDLSKALAMLHEDGARLMVLGLGSNVLISDAGFAGIVIRIGKGLDGVERGVGGDPTIWHVGAGLPTPRLARLTAQSGFGGVHRLVGVPGTVGGGVAMNAGAHGQDFSQVTQVVRVADYRGTVMDVAGKDIPWQYRDAGLHDVIVVGCTVQLAPAAADVLRSEIESHFEWRKRGTPFNEPCCGSVFRNPVASEGAPQTAGQLIDAAGLKGFTIGGARVSTKHANYVVNTGSATAADVRAVIDEIRSRVLKMFGVELQLEVKLLGD